MVDKAPGELCDEGPANGSGPCSATCGLGEPVVIDGGCGCELPGADPNDDDDRRRHGWAWLAALGLAIALRRARRGHRTPNVR